jgi:hypothetical protein
MFVGSYAAPTRGDFSERRTGWLGRADSNLETLQSKNTSFGLCQFWLDQWLYVDKDHAFRILTEALAYPRETAEPLFR